MKRSIPQRHHILIRWSVMCVLIGRSWSPDLSSLCFTALQSPLRLCHYFIYFFNCVCVISFWQIVYLLKIYSCLQGMNKLRQNLGAKLPLFRRLCKNTRFMLRKYIRFNPGGVWLNLNPSADIKKNIYIFWLCRIELSDWRRDQLLVKISSLSQKHTAITASFPRGSAVKVQSAVSSCLSVQ